MIKAIVFDCFGVLYASTFATFANKHINPQDRREYEDLYKQYDYGFIDRHFFVAEQARLAGVPLVVAEDELFGHFVIDKKLIDYVVELGSKYKTGLLSNISRETWEKIGLSLVEYFDAVSLSFETGLAKPKQEAFLDIASRVGVNIQDCVIVDDRSDNIEAALSAGMKAIAYNNLQQLQHELRVLLADAE